MKYIGVGVLGLGLAIAGASCADQPSGGGDTSTSGSAGTILDEVKLHPGTRIEGHVVEAAILSDDTMAVPAPLADPHLLNPWGLAFAPNGPAWISLNGDSTLGIFNADGTRPAAFPNGITIPGTNPSGDPATPSGMVFNPDPQDFLGDTFIAVSEDGAVIGWQSADGTTAMIQRDKFPAVYKGVAIGMTRNGPHLYAADFHDNVIDAFNADYSDATLPGSFTDPHLPAGFAPFDVVGVGPFLLVSYALQDADAHDDVKGPGNGFVDVFTTEGFFVQRLISQGKLNSPWAMVFAPDRDRRSIDLLVGNFGDGRINVYDLSLRHGRIDADFEGALGDQAGNPIVIEGLWALAFGSGGHGFDASKLYFTAGPDEEADGLFGSLTFTGPRR
jgi:uncharacterized protein (TIGR03118 family)